jgi:hypothetical protein
MTASGWTVSLAFWSGTEAVSGSSPTGNGAGFFGGGGNLAKALDRFPNPRYGGGAILELLDWGFTRQAVPDFDQPGRGPVGSQLRQRGLVAESFGIWNGIGVLYRGVSGYVVGFVFES